MTAIDSFLIALGGNLPSRAGSPGDTLRAALDALVCEGGELRAVSPFYATPCFPAGAGPDYVNAAAEIGMAGGARQMLDLLHRIEGHFGRERVQRWGRRTLDLDLIAQGQTVLPDRAGHAAWRALPLDDQMVRAPDELILPHPRLQERAFVLIPLADIAPDWRHPVLGHTIRDMVAALPAQAVAEVVRLP
ncbi:2-amino-4-hydroxy-6-hydroxymethyldihydropteridine diphosphokinase [Roseovarius sp. M141]|uniref:2-amino-4-hydroxy-6- hydroxymethyldihydropteridine diphosphokinase n=1 Tax=Roseovarius sp. M141 TaxID=2583806 RepID=UPI0020CD9D70|nr:2-amino-4-hydroxy-6-hydroxymethyldihydropteridine diphosphokinase [Roseovarius sp. M141]